MRAYLVLGALVVVILAASLPFLRHTTTTPTQSVPLAVSVEPAPATAPVAIPAPVASAKPKPKPVPVSGGVVARDPKVGNVNPAQTYFAKVVNGTVVQIIAADQAFIDSGAEGDPTLWVQTYPDASRRGYAAVTGYSYNKTTDSFAPPKASKNATTTP